MIGNPFNSIFKFSFVNISQDSLENLISCISIPLQISFAVCCSPFYLLVEKTEKNEVVSFRLKRNLLQYIFCTVLSIIDILWIIRNIRENIPEQDTKNPKIFISFIKTVISQVGCLIAIKKFWFNQQDFLRIMDHLKNEFMSLRIVSESPFSNKLFVLLISLLVPGYTLWNRMLRPLTVILWESDARIGYHTRLSKMIQTGREIFFIDWVAQHEGQTPAQISVSEVPISILDILLAITAWMATLHRLVSFFENMMVQVITKIKTIKLVCSLDILLEL